MPHTINSSGARGEAGDEHRPLEFSCLYRGDKT